MASRPSHFTVVLPASHVATSLTNYNIRSIPWMAYTGWPPSPRRRRRQLAEALLMGARYHHREFDCIALTRIHQHTISLDEALTWALQFPLPVRMLLVVQHEYVHKLEFSPVWARQPEAWLVKWLILGGHRGLTARRPRWYSISSMFAYKYLSAWLQW